MKGKGKIECTLHRLLVLIIVPGCGGREKEMTCSNGAEFCHLCWPVSVRRWPAYVAQDLLSSAPQSQHCAVPHTESPAGRMAQTGWREPWATAHSQLWASRSLDKRPPEATSSPSYPMILQTVCHCLSHVGLILFPSSYMHMQDVKGQGYNSGGEQNLYKKIIEQACTDSNHCNYTTAKDKAH